VSVRLLRTLGKWIPALAAPINQPVLLALPPKQTQLLHLSKIGWNKLNISSLFYLERVVLGKAHFLRNLRLRWRNKESRLAFWTLISAVHLSHEVSEWQTPIVFTCLSHGAHMRSYACYTVLGLVGHEVHQSASGWSPVYVEDNLGVMSIGFMLPSKDDAIIWRGPRKNGLIKQFLTDVVWNELDYLIIDTPPGTSDEHISIVQYLKSTNIDGAVCITTPQEISMADVRKELNFCKKTG
jgi:hypothetical protein